jgi:hypothetical protein
MRSGPGATLLTSTDIRRTTPHLRPSARQPSKSKLGEDAQGCQIGRARDSGEPVPMEYVERIVKNAPSRFGGISVSPMFCRELVTQLEVISVVR